MQIYCNNPTQVVKLTKNKLLYVIFAVSMATIKKAELTILLYLSLNQALITPVISLKHFI